MDLLDLLLRILEYIPQFRQSNVTVDNPRNLLPIPTLPQQDIKLIIGNGQQIANFATEHKIPKLALRTSIPMIPDLELHTGIILDSHHRILDLQMPRMFLVADTTRIVVVLVDAVFLDIGDFGQVVGHGCQDCGLVGGYCQGRFQYCHACRVQGDLLLLLVVRNLLPSWELYRAGPELQGFFYH